jgi:hypothetical protein
VTRSLGDMYLKDASFNQLPLPPLIQVRNRDVEAADRTHRGRVSSRHRFATP